MLDKREYHKLMLFAFCLITILLIAGTYSYFQGSKENILPGEYKNLAIAYVG